MELQIRMAYETALMLEQLKEIYQQDMNISLTKSDVLSKAIIDTCDLWEETEWEDLVVEVKKYDISQSALRPKLQVSNEVEEKINYLRKILSIYLGLQKYVTLGVAIKYVFRLAINQIQTNNEISINKILFETIEEHLEKEYSDEQKKILTDFVDEILLKLEKYKLL